MIPLIGLIIGLALGYILKVEIPISFSTYIPVAILAALDTVFGGVRSALDNKFDSEIFISGFFGNIILAAGLAYLGDKMNVPIYLAAVVVFGSRLFNNFAIIRRLLIEKGRKKFSHKENNL